MKRELTPDEHEEIVRAVAARDRIKATNIYLSATEGNLTDAQNYVKKLTAEAEASEPAGRNPERKNGHVINGQR